MKKKIFALLLAVLMLVPFVVACGGDTNTDTGSGNQTTDTSGSTDNTNTDKPVVEKVDTKTDKSQKWAGKTLDCVAESWGGGEPAAWDQPELYVKGSDQAGNLGKKVNDAVWARQGQIEKIYGVTMVWHKAMAPYSMQNELQTGLEAGAAKYHIATPRGYEMQSLIAADTVYDLANRKYIDLEKDYYNQAAVDSLTVYGHTFFVAGDFSYLDEYTSYVVFYNQYLSKDIQAFGNLYKMVEDGKWTISQLEKKAKLVGNDSDGTPGYTDADTYGFATNGMSGFFQSSGIKQVSVDKSSNDPSQYNYHITLNDTTKVPVLVTALVNIKSSTWARIGFSGGYGAMLDAFHDGRILFYDEVVQKIFEFKAQSENFMVAVLPMPKLNEEQESYYTPFAAQSTVMCMPKATVDEEMSEYFFDVLSWTGKEFVMRAFYQEMESRLYDDGKTSRKDALNILQNYVLNNLIFDPGYISTGMTGQFLTHVQSDTIDQATPDTSPFTNLYTEAFNDANTKLNDPKTGWNTYAKNYKD